MGLVTDSNLLAMNVRGLSKAVEAWWDCTAPAMRKRISLRIEYYLEEIKFWEHHVRKDWRAAFPTPPSPGVVNMEMDRAAPTALQPVMRKPRKKKKSQKRGSVKQ